jgi:uncharacterized protein (DUF934 family)
MLIDRTGQNLDAWNEDSGRHIMDFADLPSVLEQGGNEPLAVLVPNNTPFAAIEPYLDRLALIVLPFPSSNDGRSFSLARLIHKAGFTGILRAKGPLIADQFADALACGFDEIELTPEAASRQPWPIWEKALQAFTLGYQRSYGANILDQRRAARKNLVK